MDIWETGKGLDFVNVALRYYRCRLREMDEKPPEKRQYAVKVQFNVDADCGIKTDARQHNYLPRLILTDTLIDAVMLVQERGGKINQLLQERNGDYFLLYEADKDLFLCRYADDDNKPDSGNTDG